MLNVNAPNCPLERLGGIRTTRLAAFGAVQTVVTEQGAGYVKLAYDEIDADLEPGTDAAALAECVASVTSLHAVCEEVDAGLPDSFDLETPADRLSRLAVTPLLYPRGHGERNVSPGHRAA